MSEDIRCYICKRNVQEVVELFGIEFHLARDKMIEMRHHKFVADANLDRKGEKLYGFRHWDALHSYKSQLSPLVRKWYDSMEDSGGRDDKSITVYAYKKFDVNTRYWVADYMKHGGILLDDSEIEKVRVNFDYHLCPVCQDLIDQLEAQIILR